MAKLRTEINDRAQWNTKSGRMRPMPETRGPQPIANKDNEAVRAHGGVKFTIGENQARNLASTAPDGSEALRPGSDLGIGASIKAPDNKSEGQKT